MSEVKSHQNKKPYTFWSIRFRFVQMLARRQFGKLFKMLGTQRLGNGMFAAKPFAQVNQLAALRTERAEFSSEPVASFFASRAFDLPVFIWFRFQLF